MHCFSRCAYCMVYAGHCNIYCVAALSWTFYGYLLFPHFVFSLFFDETHCWTWRKNTVVANLHGKVRKITVTMCEISITGVEPMGLLWSMTPMPCKRTPPTFQLRDVEKPIKFLISVYRGHVSTFTSSIKPLVATSFMRCILDGGRVSRVVVDNEAVKGVLFLPKCKSAVRHCSASLSLSSQTVPADVVNIHLLSEKFINIDQHELWRCMLQARQLLHQFQPW